MYGHVFVFAVIKCAACRHKYISLNFNNINSMTCTTHTHQTLLFNSIACADAKTNEPRARANSSRKQ